MSLKMLWNTEMVDIDNYSETIKFDDYVKPDM